MDKENLYQTQPITNTLNPEEQVVQKSDPLTLELDDTEVVKVVDKWIEDSHRFFKEKYNLFERREKNEIALFGRQIAEREKQRLLKVYESRFSDNVIYEIEASLKPLAMSRLPDLIVTPGNDTEESRKVAEDITKCLDTDLKKRQNRQVAGLAFKHLPVGFTAIVKTRWDPELNDYVFENVHYDFIEVDNTCNTKNADDMNWIAQTLPITVQECVMRFPEKKKDLFRQLQLDGLEVGEKEDPPTKTLLSEIKIKEVWFKWYKKKESDKEEAEAQWECIYGVMWKYKDVVLKKMRNPNYDYEGENRYFKYDGDNKKELGQEDVVNFAMTGILPENVKEEMIYRNYFDKPRMPFFFLGYDQWRKIPYDETSRIEQNLRNQENLDKRGKSIIDKLSSRLKHIFSKDGGLKKEDIEQLDLDDPRQDLLVEGDVNKVHSAIVPEQPTSQEFKDLGDTRMRMYSLAGANAIRGEVMSDTATTSQIAREADFTRADDLVEDTVTELYEWMADWALQFIKLRYTEEHLKRLSGAQGKTTFIKINRDMIEDGMEVIIKASGTDKLKTQNRATEMAQMKMIDPLRYYRDLGLDDPEGRTEDLMLFNTDPLMYLTKVKGLGSTTPELISSLNGGDGLTPTQPVQPPALNPAAGSVPVSSQPPLPVGQPSPANTGAVPPTPTGPPMGSPRQLI